MAAAALRRSLGFVTRSASSLYWEKYTKNQRLSQRFSSEAKIFGHASHSTELVHMCLACQHFDFNSADWISDNLHVISIWYLRTMGKEFIVRFSRRWGGNAWRTPKNICVGGCGAAAFLQRRIYSLLYYYMINFCNLIGLEQWYFNLIWNTYMWKLQTFCG